MTTSLVRTPATTQTASNPPPTPAGPRRIKDSSGDRAFIIVNYCVLAFFAVAVLYPLIYVVSSSFSSGQAISSGAVKLWPVEPNVEAYKTIFSYSFILKGFANSTIYAVAGALLGTVLTILAAYPLSRDDLPLRRPLLFVILVPTLFSAGIIPSYIVVAKLGLMNTRWAIILPAAMSVFNVIITRTFYQLNVPNELLEAARIDGASDWRFFRSVALPLSKPIIAVNLLFYGIAQWNGWFTTIGRSDRPVGSAAAAADRSAPRWCRRRSSGWPVRRPGWHRG